MEDRLHLKVSHQLLQLFLLHGWQNFVASNFKTAGSASCCLSYHMYFWDCCGACRHPATFWQCLLIPEGRRYRCLALAMPLSSNQVCLQQLTLVGCGYAISLWWCSAKSRPCRCSSLKASVQCLFPGSLIQPEGNSMWALPSALQAKCISWIPQAEH